MIFRFLRLLDTRAIDKGISYNNVLLSSINVQIYLNTGWFHYIGNLRQWRWDRVDHVTQIEGMDYWSEQGYQQILLNTDK